MTVFMIESITTLLGIDIKSDKDILKFVYLRLLFTYVMMEDKIFTEKILKVFSIFVIDKKVKVFVKDLCYNVHMNKFLSVNTAIYSLKEFILLFTPLGNNFTISMNILKYTSFSVDNIIIYMLKDKKY